MSGELRLTLPNDLRELARVNELAHAFLERHMLAPKTLYTTSLAIEEVLSNVIRHGYQDADRHEISLCLRIDQGSVELLVEDDGREFDPSSAPEVDLLAPLEERRAGGLGIHLLRTLTRGLRYERKDGRNHLRVRI